MIEKSIKEFINKIPKAELHVHVEGTFEPELIFKIAKRNKISLKYKDINELKLAYKFNNLQEFLNIYYQGASILKTEEDFYDLTLAYMKNAKKQNIVHSEIFFDPQTHTERGVKFSTIIKGIHRGLSEGLKKYKVSSKLIMSFLRHLDEASALSSLKESLKYKDWICAVGLDSSEMGHPPSKFKNVFTIAKNEGFIAVAHAGEEGPAKYMWEAVNLLHVSRIDHGNACIKDDNLVNELVRINMPLTLCPLSNLNLKVVDDLKKHPIKKMMDRGLLVTVNSDDPAYFGGYINENYYALAEALNLSKKDICILAKNSISASFLNEKEKKANINLIEKEFCNDDNTNK